MKKSFIVFAERIINTTQVISITHDDECIYLHMVGDLHCTENYESNPMRMKTRWSGLLMLLV